MPEIEGQEFPAYEFREYPKALYPGGQAADADGKLNRPFIANDEEHEAELKAEHEALELAALPTPEPKGAEEEPEAGAESTSGEAGAEAE